MHSTQSSDEKSRRGIYLLPNLFTTAALFSGFYAVVAGMQGLFAHAAIAIFVAMLMDSLDGRVARLTHTQSAFGGEYDSLADMVSFGVAPALVSYSMSLHFFGKAGWLIAFLYTAATALRLARFNTQSSNPDKRYFQGLPCPAAAATIAGLVWLVFDYQWKGLPVNLLFATFTLGLALLQISGFRYYSFKEIDVRGKIPFIAAFALVLGFVAISLDPPTMLFALLFCYLISGPIATLYCLTRRRVKNK